MAAPKGDASTFDSWLNNRLEALEIDKDVYAVYIHGVLQEEDSDQERCDALRDILSAFLEEDTLEETCKEILAEWWKGKMNTDTKGINDEVEAIANMIGKQAQIVVRQRDVSEDDKQRKATLLAQYANVTDEEDECEVEEGAQAASGTTLPGDKSLFKNVNVEAVMNAKKIEREAMREGAQKKKEQDKLQREKDKLAKQERKEKEKKRTQKGERKR